MAKKLGKHLKAHREDVLEQVDLELEEVSGGGHEEGSIQDFISNNQTLLLGGLGVIILLIAGVFGWNYWQSRKSVEAGDRMFQAIHYFESNNFALALNGDSLGAEGFEGIISSYGGTDAGNLAKYYAGVSYLKLGDLVNGVSYLEDFSKDDNLLSVSAYMALGFAYEEQGDFTAAASNFARGADAVNSNDQTTPLMLLNAGRNYEAAGEKGKALTAYKKIKEKYPKSTEARDIDKYIGRAS